MAGEAVPVAGVVIDEEDHGVVVPCLEVDAANLRGFGDDSLGEKEAHDEEFVIARGAHEDGERAAIDDDLEGLLDRDGVIAGFGLAARPAGDLTAERGGVHGWFKRVGWGSRQSRPRSGYWRQRGAYHPGR